jgi:hypothetical protein
MKIVENYKTRIRDMFFVSIKNDLNLWSAGNINYYGPLYNETKFVIDINSTYCFLLLRNAQNDQKIISRYKWYFIPIDFKVWIYVKKLKKHFKEIKEIKIHEEEIIFLKTGLENIEKNFIKEVRKNKLKQIKENE